MAISDITGPQPILDAIAEFDRLGSDGFLRKYGFGPSRSYWLLHNGKRYDSKAIVGAAHGYARPDLGPLPASAFSGGEARVQRKLEQLGFELEVGGPVGARGERTSDRLSSGTVYTRDDLRGLFGIMDATINNGVFHPKGTSSVWLFVTEEKTADRTQYRDHLEGEQLYWQGQSSGRTDALIVEHQARGLELLVFFRKRKYEHSGAGFRYLGPFAYLRHEGGHPTSFVLQHQPVAPVMSADEADTERFDPTTVEDARKRILRSIAQRRGQKRFREDLIAAYQGRCAISGSAVRDVLEAAHIYPYRGADTNKVDNGLLLRADLHTLFDCGLIAVDVSTMTVLVSPRLQESEYTAFHGSRLRPPQIPTQVPSEEALNLHRRSAGL